MSGRLRFNLSKAGIAWTLGAALVTSLGFLWAHWARAFTSSVVKEFVSVGFGLLLFVLLVVAGGAAFFLFRAERRVLGMLAGVLAAGLLGFTVYYGVLNTYKTARDGYFPSITFTHGTLPDYETRAPMPQAKGLLPRNQGDCVGKMKDVNYVLDAKGGHWTGFVDGNGWSRPAGCVVSWDGKGQERSDFQVCTFEAPTRAIEGTWGNNLNRAVQRHIPRGMSFNESDSYANCEDGHAVLYLPLVQPSGFYHSHDVPGGLVVVKSTSDIRYYPTVKKGQFSGPVYPLSIARTQEWANRANSGWSQWRGSVSGYEAAGTVEGHDPLDPNLGNQAQFVLRNKQTGGSEYVTPLTPVGSGNQIIAASHIEADHVEAGALNPMTLVHFDTPRSANATAAQQIRSAYATMLPWANANLQILEITPAADGKWHATIGRQLDLLYTVDIAEDNSTTLTDVLTGKVIATATAEGLSTAVDAPSPASSSKGGAVPTGTPAQLGTDSTDDLIRLRDQIQAELDKRAKAASQGTAPAVGK